MIRLFVGLALPEAVRDRLAPLGRGIPGARRVDPENMHLTLRFIGNVDDRMAADIDDALVRVRAPAFDMAIEGLGLFHKGRQPTMLWAGVARNPALEHLQGRVESATRRAGVPPETRRFTPHVTVARLRDASRPRLAEMLAHHNLLRLPPFRVDHFVLFSSFLSHNGATYRAEAQYPLTAGSAAPGIFPADGGYAEFDH